MMISLSQMRRASWVLLLVFAICAFLALSFHVNAIKSEVQLKERRIVALERKKTLLETEFQTRANQQQLADWNAVEFGYQAPRASQYLENDRQLEQLGSPHGPGDPQPIRVARTGKPGEGAFPAMVSPLTGQPIGKHGSNAATADEGDGVPASDADAQTGQGKTEGVPQ